MGGNIGPFLRATGKNCPLVESEEPVSKLVSKPRIALSRVKWRGVLLGEGLTRVSCGSTWFQLHRFFIRVMFN